MKTLRIGIHLVSVILLALWGGVMLYFYASGRISKYLQSEGIFQPMVLIGGVGLVVLALFNLLTMGAEESDCCEHDHDHDHDHGGCGHDHSRDEGPGAGCGHDHSHGHAHDHAHAEAHDHGCCGHDHDHAHKESHVCCGHDHGHHHEHAHSHEGHAHGILDESGMAGRLVAIFILAVPVTYAAIRTPDQFSINTITNKGGYSSVIDAAGAVQHSIKNKAAGKPAPEDTAAAADANKPDAPPPAASSQAAVPAAAVAAAPPSASTSLPAAVTALPPATVSTTTTSGAGASPAAAAAAASAPPSGAKDTKSYGGFTLADLEAQVPKSKAGNFMLDVPEIYYTAGDKEVQTVLAGQSVETVAQVLPEKVNNAEGRRLRVFRLQIQCCAADARPYSIPVEFSDKAPTIKDMTWVKVTGKMAYRQEGGQTVPLLEAKSIDETAAPENATMY